MKFVDFEKAFESIYRESLWDQIRLIKMLYDDFCGAVLHEESRFFAVKSGVKQGCLLSGFLFILIINWLIHKKGYGEQRQDIEWLGGEVPEDINFADDLALPSENFNDAQEKMTRLASKAKSVGLKVNAKNTQILGMNSWDDSPVVLNGAELKDVEFFVYLGSTLNKTVAHTRILMQEFRRHGLYLIS